MRNTGAKIWGMPLGLVEFTVDGFPPAYDSGFSILNPKHSRYPLVHRLQERAREAMQGKKLLKGDVALELEHEIFTGDRRTDVVNLIGGVANALEGIVYSDDNQIREIRARQVSSQRDSYNVRVREL